MSYHNTSLNTPLKKVRGLGSAKDGTAHWWAQRVTAVLLVPLCFWFVSSLLNHVVGKDRQAVAEWFSSPVVAICWLVLLTAAFYHAKLGMQVIIEDYVHTPCKKTALLIGNILFFSILTIVSWTAILKLHMMGI